MFSWRTVRAGLFGLVCLATLIGLFYAEENWRGPWAWNRFKRELEAKGEKMDWRAFVPPPVPDEQNFAMTPLLRPILDYQRSEDPQNPQVKWRDTNGLTRLRGIHLWRADAPTNPPSSNPECPWRNGQRLDLAAWQTYFRSVLASNAQPGAPGAQGTNDSRRSPQPGKDTRGRRLTAPTNWFPVAAQPQTAALDVLLALSCYDKELEELRLASTRPRARFPVHYDEGMGTLLPHLGTLRALSHLPNLRAVAALEAGRSDQALQDVMLSFHLADAVKEEPFGISHLVRLTMINESLQAVWEGLAGHRWSSNHLTVLMDYLKTPDLLGEYAGVIRSERSMSGMARSLSDAKQRKELLRDMFPAERLPSRFVQSLGWFPKGWFYLNDLTAARFYQDKVLPLIDPAARRAYPGPARAALREFEDAPARPHNAIVHFFGLFIVPEQFARAQTHLDLARVACALERYWQVHGHFPETTADLFPACLDKLPTDIVTGQPLQYRRTDNGQFVLYSVGWDETDDQGQFPSATSEPTRGWFLWAWMVKSTEKGDWVWRYPADNRVAAR